MDDNLPSYGEATTRDHWSIIASFVRSADLCSAALVCREWNRIFSPLLWGNPASHFGRENDAVYVALVRFKRTLLWARPSTREQTHTLHFPPAQAEIYGGPHSEWLRDILDRLPKLQSLVVSHLPFFDHGALSSLVRLGQSNNVQGLTAATYNLRLLDASYCNNVTPHALAAALKLFPALIYLDLSGTSSARYPEVLSSLAYIPALQILKLQRLFLDDDELNVLIRAIGRKLRSLDLRWNRITDQGVRNLIQDSIRPNMTLIGYESPHRFNTKLQQILDSHQQDEFICDQLTSGFVTYLGIECMSGQGLTHLYISNNLVTIAGASGLLKCAQLRVLDLGDIVTETLVRGPTEYDTRRMYPSLPRAENLIPIIENHAEGLTYLRINHAVVTQPVPAKDCKVVEMDGTTSALPPRGVVELDTAQHVINEMPDDRQNELIADFTVYAELDGSPVTTIPLHEQVSSPGIRVQESIINANVNAEPASVVSPTVDSSGGLFSPISPMSLDMPKPLQLHHSSSGSLLRIQMEGTYTPESLSGLEVDERTIDTDLPEVVQYDHRTYSGVWDDHESRLRFRRSQTHALLPGTLGNIRTLVLSSVPSKPDTPEIAARIIDFIKGCAEEEQWAELLASVGYQLPPGRDRRSAERHYAHTLFPLEKLVLEVVSKQDGADSQSGWIRPSSQSRMLSSTLDPDCETYLNAARHDFSFFGSEECGQPDREGLAPFPTAIFREKMTHADDCQTLKGHNNTAGIQRVYDVIGDISSFRQAKKEEHNFACGNGHIDGYWSGTIEVVRPMH
ncbi:uncharacterized protein PV09_06970 [Verruconis gallopava]|uniref:F-box domain-containing protein n=1 Tax=Verruconis gallopava TaxID=253628 RepID=A0A0D2A4U2_9PEZI|nr:uncharacterized protein PV09_06970 [Verruconis gallopava]KIW01490.1 hypothetical protein PV09_06970 [Verruconis gallopava]